MPTVYKLQAIILRVMELPKWYSDAYMDTASQTNQAYMNNTFPVQGVIKLMFDFTMYGINTLYIYNFLKPAIVLNIKCIFIRISNNKIYSNIHWVKCLIFFMYWKYVFIYSRSSFLDQTKKVRVQFICFRRSSI